jgi:hypothetical protein
VLAVHPPKPEQAIPAVGAAFGKDLWAVGTLERDGSRTLVVAGAGCPETQPNGGGLRTA